MSPTASTASWPRCRHTARRPATWQTWPGGCAAGSAPRPPPGGCRMAGWPRRSTWWPPPKLDRSRRLERCGEQAGRLMSDDDIAQLKLMRDRGEISDEQYEVLRRHVLWGTPLPEAMESLAGEEPGQPGSRHSRQDQPQPRSI